MKNQVLEDIKILIKERFMKEYGFCGVADGDNFCTLNGGGKGENLIIKIEDKSE